MDSDALFSSHTIEEIRAVEHKTRFITSLLLSFYYFYLDSKWIKVFYYFHRGDIERKKEDLRLMVG